METVFDYKITLEEWAEINGMSKEVYLSSACQEDAYQDLATLFYIRGDGQQTMQTSCRPMPGMICGAL